MPRSRLCQSKAMAKSGDVRSPRPGTRPSIGSSPMRNSVPGSTKAESSRREICRNAFRRCSCPSVSARGRVARSTRNARLPIANHFQCPTPKRTSDSYLNPTLGVCLEYRTLGVVGRWKLDVGSLFKSPLDQQSANREAGADRHHQQRVATLEPVAVHGIAEREGNRRGGRVAEFLDVDDDLLFGHA